MSVSNTSSALSLQASIEAMPRFAYASVIRSVGNSDALPALPPQISPLLKQPAPHSPLMALLSPQQQRVPPESKPISSSSQPPLSQKKFTPYGQLDKNRKKAVEKRAIELLTSVPKKTRLEIIKNLRQEFKIEYYHANLKRCALKAGISFDAEIAAKKTEKEEAKQKAIQYINEKTPYRKTAKIIGVAASTITNWVKEQKSGAQPSTSKKTQITKIK